MVNGVQAIEISEFPLFQGVTQDVIEHFLDSGSSFLYKAGSPIIIANDMGETFFLVMGGLAKIVILNEKKDAINVTLFRAGDCFGELSMLEATPSRAANVFAATDVEVFAVQKPIFMNLMHAHPELAINLARILGQRLKSMNERMLSLNMPDLHRISSTLLYLARQGRSFTDQGPVLLPNLPLKDWVVFCNSSQDKFMEIMEHLRNAGVVEWSNQRIVVKNLSLLSKLSVPDPSKIA